MTFCNVNSYKSISLFFCLVLHIFLTNVYCAPSKKVIKNVSRVFRHWGKKE